MCRGKVPVRTPHARVACGERAAVQLGGPLQADALPELRNARCVRPRLLCVCVFYCIGLCAGCGSCFTFVSFLSSFFFMAVPCLPRRCCACRASSRVCSPTHHHPSLACCGCCAPPQTPSPFRFLMLIPLPFPYPHGWLRRRCRHCQRVIHPPCAARRPWCSHAVWGGRPRRPSGGPKPPHA